MKKNLLNIIRSNAVSAMMLALLSLPSCWEGYNDVMSEKGSDSDAPVEVVMINSSLATTSMTLNWTEPAESGFSHVIVSWTGASSGTATCQKGTTQCTISGSAGNEFTVTLKTVDLAGNESAGVVFGVTIPSSAMTLRFIYNQSQLTSFSNNYNILMSDITLTGTWTPSSLTTNGIVDGNGHVIRNVTCSGAAPRGFFTYINAGSIVKNLGIEDVNINVTSGNGTGGLTGENNGNLTNCYVTGTITGLAYTGGLVGNNGGTITDSHASISISDTGVSGQQYHGGLVGYNSGPITRCYTSGNMTGSIRTKGGLAGRNGSSIIESHSSVNITTDVFSAGSGADYGGLVGDNQSGSITKCYATGIITGYANTGGLIGINYATVEKSYSAGTVYGTSNTGGLVGYNSGTINICYTAGKVSYPDGYYGNNQGGIAGTNANATGIIQNCYSRSLVDGNPSGGICGRMDYNGTVVNCYFLGTLTNSWGGGIAGYIQSGTVTNSYHNSPDGYYGPYGTQIADINNMKIQSTYSSWNFSTIWSIDSTRTINNGYPYLTGMAP